MAYDEGMAQIMRNALVDLDGVSERKMFGGLCFMIHGHMVGGVTSKGHGMFRLGKENEAKAVALEGIDPLSFTGKKMGGMVECHGEFFETDQFGRVMGLAINYVKGLPPK